MKGNGKKTSESQKTLALKKGVDQAPAESSKSAVDIRGFHGRIAAKAFELYEKRGCSHGCDLDDWLLAERLVRSDRKLIKTDLHATNQPRSGGS